MVYLLKMVIFHCYVSSPEGKPSLNETRICGKTGSRTPGSVLELGQSLDVPTAQGMSMDQWLPKYHLGLGARHNIHGKLTLW